MVILAFFHRRIELTIGELLLGLDFPVPFPSMAQAFLITTVLFVAIVPLAELFRNRPFPIMNIAVTVFGVMYVPAFLGSLVGLREVFIPEEFPVARHFPVLGLAIPQEVVQTIDGWGGWTLIAVFASIWVCDSAAYFVGRALGRHSLAPRISPHKTVEGALAGLVAAVLMFVVAKALVLSYLSFGQALVCGIVVGIFGQMGDLVESLIKRDSGVKDSSTLIPGHGGVLDRFDSLILVSPILFLYFEFVVFAR
jgi:phosphatidate cytidylyltransferase